MGRRVPVIHTYATPCSGPARAPPAASPPFVLLPTLFSNGSRHDILELSPGKVVAGLSCSEAGRAHHSVVRTSSSCSAPPEGSRPLE